MRLARRRAGARGAGGGGGRRGDAGGERRLLTEDSVRGEGSADAAERGAVELTTVEGSRRLNVGDARGFRLGGRRRGRGVEFKK